jgi:hypothetical protein
MKFAWRSTSNSPLSSPGALPGILPGRRWIASMPRSGSIPTHSDLPGREVLAALRPAPDPGRLIAIDPDLDPIGPERRFEPLLENWVVRSTEATSDQTASVSSDRCVQGALIGQRKLTGLPTGCRRISSRPRTPRSRPFWVVTRVSLYTVRLEGSRGVAYLLRLSWGTP